MPVSIVRRCRADSSAAIERNEVVKILNPFAGAEIDAEARAIDRGIVTGRPASARACWAAAAAKQLLAPELAHSLRIANVLAQIEILDLGRELGRKRAGIEQRDRPDAAAAFELIAVEIVHGNAQRRDRAHAGDDNTSSHDQLLSSSLPPLTREAHASHSATLLAHHGRTLAQVGEADLQNVRLRHGPHGSQHDVKRAAESGSSQLSVAGMMPCLRASKLAANSDRAAAGAEVAEIALDGPDRYRSRRTGQCFHQAASLRRHPLPAIPGRGR